MQGRIVYCAVSVLTATSVSTVVFSQLGLSGNCHVAWVAKAFALTGKMSAA